MVMLWERMIQVYGHRWSSAFGEATDKSGGLSDAARIWQVGLRKMTRDMIKSGLNRCLDRADGWPPTLPEFRALCASPADWATRRIHAADQKNQQRRLALPKPGKITAPGDARAHLRHIRQMLKTDDPVDGELIEERFVSDPKRRARIEQQFLDEMKKLNAEKELSDE